MTHEFKKIVETYTKAQEQGLQAVLATVVALEGSSYRRPGVRMLILSNGKMVGAVSGGCVEKEIQKQSDSVFKSGLSKMMTYDGRYRLGCEGILYILIEPFRLSEKFMQVFDRTLQKRHPFKVSSYFIKSNGENKDFGSFFWFGKEEFALRPDMNIAYNKNNPRLDIFEQEMEPCFQLIICGAEHDAVQLCSFAAMAGWNVIIVTTPSEGKNSSNFPGATTFLELLPEEFIVAGIDKHTALVIMSHSYAKDLKYLMALKDTIPGYLGLLGPAKRRERLLNDLMEYCPDLPEDFFDRIHGPAGLNIGAETSQEIALAILAEILAVIRAQNPIMLKNKKRGIHN